MKATITIGCSGSGKTTWAKTQKAKIISRDDFRVRIHEETSDKPFSWKDWKWKNEDEVTDRVEAEIKVSAELGLDIILADTNLSKNRMLNLKQKLIDLGYQVQLKFFHGHRADEHVSIDQCLKRDSQRELSVGPEVIHKQWKQMIDAYQNDIFQQYSPVTGTPNAIIVDVDGTIADHRGIRGPFDWHKVIEDRPIWWVIEIVRAARASGKSIIIMSGRDSVCREQTVRWLNLHGIKYDILLMRAEGDSRSDDLVKQELFFDYIADHYNINYAIDDRKKMVQRWTDIGIKVLNVGHINEYF